VNDQIITSPTTVLVAVLHPAINGKNELLITMTAREEDLQVVGPELHSVNDQIITSPMTVLVAALRPAINGKNDL
jgi:hypothetical protein